LTPATSGSVEVCLTGRVAILVAGMAPDLRDRLRRTAAFANPEFFERERARLSTHKTPRVIACGGRNEDRTDWASPDTVTGWWCARCGNVDMPQPCIGVCVWRPADWVNFARYERQLRLAEPGLRAARSSSGSLARVAAVTPRAGQWRRNWGALQAQARAALVDSPRTRPHPSRRRPARRGQTPTR
jgi:hypothetical protein